MAIAPGLALFQVALLASWLMPSPVAAFTGIQTYRRKASATISFGNNIQGKNREFHPASINARYLGAKNDDNEEEEDGDPLMNDQREGMSDAFSALDSLSANDFDDFLPLSSTSNEGSDDSIGTDGSNMEDSAKLFMEMQAELSTLGEDGVYDDMLGDLSGENPKNDAPKSYLNTDEEDVTGLGKALDEAADLADASSVLNDADGFGTLDSTTDNPTMPLTTADVSNDILTQEIEPSLSMDEFMASAMQEAVNEIDIASEMVSSSGAGRTLDIAKTAEQLLEDEELRKDIESLFDTAGAKLRLEVEAMKKEQEAVTQEASKLGLDYIESEKRRISETEASVTRMIQKVARETDEVQKAMENLELAKNQASGDGGSGSIEETAIDLKKGGLIKQAALVGGLLLGSRAVTETILVLNSPYGDQHFVPAIVQAAIALACAAYFFLAK
eukprot:CAMPEP_0201953634 /NCGR_PEP_ID=MMETSP0904-20121228/1902_1 /ASSEMBLY_ACC=CAM_ASM_000553 /TAXON_ID=420261 /ORGANISM="Thalassiosira antarctica, Strain CCMP982" /LENGTH=443 /DNA_ID=CAMNT_0048497505 /DNA_START=70 /DNA_END=1401 /DNA_ORIENTATION=-